MDDNEQDKHVQDTSKAPSQPSVSQENGGVGSLYPDQEGLKRSELALERRALRRRWPVPAEKRKEIIARQIRIAIHATKDTDAVRAFKALLMAEELDTVRLGGGKGNVSVSVDVQVAARESAVFGGLNLDAFKLAAQHQVRQVEQRGLIPGETQC